MGTAPLVLGSMAPEPVVPPQRVFFAVWPDAAARTTLAKLAREIAVSHGGRPTAPELLHLTLAFLGDQPALRVEALRHVADGIRARSFVLVLDELGAFRRAGVTWLGASVPQSGLEVLHRELAAALQRQGFPVEARPYAPHLTLTRRSASEIGRRLLQPVSWCVASFALVESKLGRDGTAYRTLAEWPLAPG